MSSRHRLYLNLKQSITKLFKTPAHYLKEITGKQSLFEKPYLDQDYRQMHLNLPMPRWKRPEFDPGLGGPWPRPRKVTFVFDDGICSLSGQTGECGEIISLSGWIGLVPLGSLGREISWVAQSSDPNGAQIEGISLGLSGMSASIQVRLGDSFTGTVKICAQAFMTEGLTLKEVAYMVPSQLGGVPTVPGWVPSFQYASRNLLPIYEVRGGVENWNCGCVDLEVDCCDDSGMAWDTTISAETVARSSSCTVAITDSLEAGNPYSWSVSGTGFTLTNSETNGLTNSLIADGSACGTAHITVTGCDGNSVTGCVRCTFGTWNLVSSCSQNGGDKSEATNQERILLTGSGCTQHARKEEFWGECCDPTVCGSGSACCGYFWNDYCSYCSAQPVLTSVKGIGEYSDWECS